MRLNFCSLFIYMFSILTVATCWGQQANQNRKKKGAAQVVAPPIDLLKDFKPDIQVVRGQWNKVDKGLRSNQWRDALVQFPVSVLGSFRIDMEFTRQVGHGPISLSCPVFPRNLLLELGGHNDKYSGLALLELKSASKLPVGTGLQISPSGLTNGMRQKLELAIQRQGQRVAVAAKLDGRPIVDWQAPIEKFNGWGGATPHNPYVFGIRAHETVLDIHHLNLTPEAGCQVYECGEVWSIPWHTVSQQPRNPSMCRLTFNGKRYFISESKMSATNAHALAASMQGRLLTISTEEEFDFILKEGLGLNYFVDGWHQPAQGWRNSHNQAVSIVGHWGPSQPDYKTIETQLGIATSLNSNGYHDFLPETEMYACIEWGDE